MVAFWNELGTGTGRVWAEVGEEGGRMEVEIKLVFQAQSSLPVMSWIQFVMGSSQDLCDGPFHTCTLGLHYL